MEGWIKIHRQIKEHWIWDDPLYLKAWLGILLTVNHDDKKILIQGELIECKRGQSILSLTGWVKCFGKKWTMQRVRTFFELLKRDSMIITEGLRKTTRLTVCNYDNYQFEQQAKNKQRTSKQQTDNILTTTNKNEEEIKNDNKEEDEITKAWNRWKEFKRIEFGFNYKSEISEQSAKTELINLSENNVEIAIKIIEQSIAKGWKGFFKLKTNNNEFNKKTVGASNEAVARIIAENFGVDVAK